MTSADTSSSLLLRIRDPQDAVSWNLFVDVYTPVVYRYLVKRGLQDADASDCAQEALIEVARSIQKFEYRPEAGRFRDWLAVVVRRRLYRFWKQRHHEPLYAQDMQASRDDAEWTEVYQSELLRTAIERVRQEFEEKTWLAFSLTWLEERPAADVSRQLEMPIDLVYSAKARFLKRLESEVKMLGDDCGWLDTA